MIADDSICPPEVPTHLFEGLRAFALEGRRPGGFLCSLLSNDLRATCEKADLISRRAIFDIVSYVYNELPGNCWGSPAQVDMWIELGGLNGVMAGGGS